MKPVLALSLLLAACATARRAEAPPASWSVDASSRMAATHCPACGASVPRDGRSCPSCGARYRVEPGVVDCPQCPAAGEEASSCAACGGAGTITLK